MVASLPLLSCEFTVSMKENPDGKKMFNSLAMSLKNLLKLSATFASLLKMSLFSRRVILEFVE